MNPEPEATPKDCPATAPPHTKNRSLPFSKTSPIWLAVDSMEAFKKFPQKPHFAPLRELREAQREGQAIAHMVTFSTLVEKAFGLLSYDRNSRFNECLEALNDLECHGFDIKPIELHVKKLLSTKEKLDEIVREGFFRNADKCIKALNRDKEIIDEVIMKLNQELKALESDEEIMKLNQELKAMESVRESNEGWLKAWAETMEKKSVKKKLSLGMEPGIDDLVSRSP